MQINRGVVITEGMFNILDLMDSDKAYSVIVKIKDFALNGEKIEINTSDEMEVLFFKQYMEVIENSVKRYKDKIKENREKKEIAKCRKEVIKLCKQTGSPIDVDGLIEHLEQDYSDNVIHHGIYTNCGVKVKNKKVRIT